MRLDFASQKSILAACPTATATLNLNLILDGCTITGNTTANQGGGVRQAGGTVTVTNGTSFTTDQRGQPRIVGAFADLGAVEGVFSTNFPLVNVTQLGSGNVQV